MRLLQGLPGILDTPGAHGVSAARGDGPEIHPGDASALDDIGLAVAHQGEAAVDGCDLHRHGTVGACHDEH
ncbi:MAG: hypothetical protein J4F45_06705 [Pseudomonadales bacterium]|nr:hypothetical protein [Pseudomonadales bacterium]